VHTLIDAPPLRRRSDGRRAFLSDEEAAILRIVRKKKIWPAFEHTSSRVGLKGFRAKGFSERRQGGARAPSTMNLTKREALQADKRTRVECEAHMMMGRNDGALRRDENRTMPLEIDFSTVRLDDERPPSPLPWDELDELVLMSLLNN
jgi:hypothetical protein